MATASVWAPWRSLATLHLKDHCLGGAAVAAAASSMFVDRRDAVDVELGRTAIIRDDAITATAAEPVRSSSSTVLRPKPSPRSISGTQLLLTFSIQRRTRSGAGTAKRMNTA